VCKKTCNFCGCVDTNSYCPIWAKQGDCLTNPVWMQTNCRKSCKTCEGKPLQPPPGCNDHHVNCQLWVSMGECQRNPLFMHPHCSKSCNTCLFMPCMDYVQSACSDPSPWACRNYPIIKKACRRTCGYCLYDAREDYVDQICYDASKRCGTLTFTQEKCFSKGGWGDWMFKNCKKFCQYCLPGHPGKIIKDHPHYQDITEAPPTTTTTTMPRTIAPSGGPTSVPGCDDDPQFPCKQEAEKGRCMMWVEYMLLHCPWSCGYCGNQGICADDADLQGKCPQYKKAQGCGLVWMQKRCAKTCDTCWRH